METEPLSPIAPPHKTAATPAKGRLADLLACGLAILAAILSAFTALRFFLGFAANDTHLAGLSSAFIFSIFLGVFAVGPAIIIARLAFLGWKSGLVLKQALWVLCLGMPWVVLSVLIIKHTPLPIYAGWTAFTLSSLLCLWAAISIYLSHSGTQSRQ
ncbi:hypothetical protein DES40_2152 [Litorimonas taeanensis]|uniref:Uncharacterized protein n=1 Tax=Litorimonas taeanensis TaxID=568099 RepID=A0A420WEL1_9PROT|nr:hypothetical protein [Litorimonas taeanensis]RKQ69352.1 hypothetical protein DES40_2152 [Litorimonas taeanensis]